MSALPELAKRFQPILAEYTDDVDAALDMIRASQDPKFGDYQANFAMPLGKKAGKNPRELAQEIVDRVDLSDMCETPEIAGPGFINLRLRDDWIIGRLQNAVVDQRLAVPTVESPRRYIIDYSAPNVAKPMHVGHIRSTVIGNSLARILRFVGHDVITDNHIGDWGTQFGMIIYGYRNFLNPEAYAAASVTELARLYRLVRRLVDYQDGRRKLPEESARIEKMAEELETAKAAAAQTEKPDKKTRKAISRLETKLQEAREELDSLRVKLAEVEADAELSELAVEHADISRAVLNETAKLHADDEGNLELWRQFLPACEDEMNRVYARLDVSFDHALGESFYHNRLGPIVDLLLERGIAKESDGAVCIFFDGQDVPMLVRKSDGAFLYATTDLATIEYRMETWEPDAVLYVVDHRQSLHFEHLFEAARMLGHEDIELKHVSFGTVLGEDGKPFKTRSGDTVGLEGLLDEAVRRVAEIVAESNADRKARDEEPIPENECQMIAERVGTAALMYADLSQNRESDYTFSYDKMVATNGNTATYMQYAYARVRSIFAKGGVEAEEMRQGEHTILFTHPAERAIAIELLRFGEVIEIALKDYRPNYLTDYLFELSKRYSSFFDQCPVLKAENVDLRNSRLLLCDLTARTIQKGLELLGIRTVERM